MIFSAAKPLHSSGDTGARLPRRVQWGWLIVVAGAHAGGLAALSGLGGISPVATEAPSVTVRLIAPEVAHLDDPSPAPVASLGLRPKPVDRRPGYDRPPGSPSPSREPARPTAQTAPTDTASTAADPSPHPDASVAADQPAEPSTAPSEITQPVLAGAPAEPDLRAHAETGRMKTESPAWFDAAYLHNPAPSYPAISRRRGEEGLVVLRVRILDDGRAGELEIAQSSGYRRLDTAALETVREWRFVPARVGETGHASWLRVPVAFRLED